MKTSLDFEGPADLSVGQIRISNNKGVVKDWIATPDQRSLREDQLEPGYYMAEISPAGVRSQSVVFEVKRGEANTVAVPDFAALAASGNGTNFLDVSDRDAAIQAVYHFVPDPPADGSDTVVSFTAEPHEQSLATDAKLSWLPLAADEPATGRAEPEELTAPKGSRLLSVALAMERQGHNEAWEQFSGSCTAQLTSGRLMLEIAPPSEWTPASGRRARLTVAIEAVRIERLLLPLFRGGTTVSITPSALSLNDISLEILPKDPKLRAIWRALEAGTRKHAAAVRDHVLALKGSEPISAVDAADPWGAMLAGLLFLRFPEEFGNLNPNWAQELCERHPWAADVFVIRARQLSAAAGETPGSVAASAERSVELLRAAQVRGSPYFNQSNQFFSELLESLAGFELLSPNAASRVKQMRHRWQRELPLQRSAGVSFSWLSRDPQLLKETNILAPKRNISGRLYSRDASVVFKGRVSSSAIAFESPISAAPKTTGNETYELNASAETVVETDHFAPSDCPALMQPPGPDDDPNKGRFGGQAEIGGFRLSARFPRDDPKQVPVLLSVKANESALLNLGDYVWFCLHPTFNPEWVKVFFRGRSANLSVRAWGGFTVGAWLPSHGVELERDLASYEAAPRIIREL